MPLNRHAFRFEETIIRYSIELRLDGGCSIRSFGPIDSGDNKQHHILLLFNLAFLIVIISLSTIWVLLHFLNVVKADMEENDPTQKDVEDRALVKELN